MDTPRRLEITRPATAARLVPQGSQHRRVFIANMPHNGTEEQLIEICYIAGPVVSFRLVPHRETGKPKGYSSYEHLDEETAVTARSNLQGHWINWRQLRIDFAENDRKREVQDHHPVASSLGNDPQYLAKISD